jgi:outer membrane protein OmpA-like peptidoglycan-associated protein
MIKTHFGRIMAIGLATTILATTPAWADGNNVKGLIVSHTGNTVVVKDQNNVAQTITILPTTEVKSVGGKLGLDKKDVAPTALIPGLPVSIDVVANGSETDAVKVEFKDSDFKTAQQIQAGLNPTEQQVQANAAGIAAADSRMNDFGTNKTITTADVFFASGSTAISQQGKSDLMSFAQTAKNTKGYKVTVQGYTDSTGNAAENQRLSKARANNVQNFLQQQGGLSTARVSSGDGMGVAANAGSGSNQDARKVTVRLYVDKGVADGN